MLSISTQRVAVNLLIYNCPILLISLYACLLSPPTFILVLIYTYKMYTSNYYVPIKSGETCIKVALITVKETALSEPQYVMFPS